MTYHHLGPWAYASGEYADTPPPVKLLIPVDTFVVDLTDPQNDE